MTNLIIDLSNLAHRSLFACNNYGANNYTFEKKYEIDRFIRKLATDITFIIRQFNCPRVIFAVDSQSWRKNISIDENEGYKGNRKKSETINWECVYKAIDEFTDILNNNGFITTKIKNAEADDIMALWQEELLFNLKQHVIIVSADEDIRQLVTANKEHNVFCVVHNPMIAGKQKSKKLYIPEGFNEWLETNGVADIFNRNIDVDKDDFIRLRDKECILFENVNGNNIAMDKVLCGDDGDNVPAIYEWKGKTDNKIRITPKKAEYIIENLQAKTYKDFINNEDKLYELIEKIAGHQPTIKIKDRLLRQLKLVVLSKEFFPASIVSEFRVNVKDKIAKPNIRAFDYKMTNLLEGSSFVGSKSENEISLFRDIDNIVNML